MIKLEVPERVADFIEFPEELVLNIICLSHDKQANIITDIWIMPRSYEGLTSKC